MSVCEACGRPECPTRDPMGHSYEEVIDCLRLALSRVTAERDEAREELAGAHELLRVTREAHGEEIAEVARLRKALEEQQPRLNDAYEEAVEEGSYALILRKLYEARSAISRALSSTGDEGEAGAEATAGRGSSLASTEGARAPEHAPASSGAEGPKEGT